MTKHKPKKDDTFYIIIFIAFVIVIILVYYNTYSIYNKTRGGGILIPQEKTKSFLPPCKLSSLRSGGHAPKKTVSFNFHKSGSRIFEKRDPPADLLKKSSAYRKARYNRNT